MTNSLQLPLAMDEAELAALDPLTLQQWFTFLVEKQDAHNSDPERVPELSSAEARFAISLTQILRRTNTGPAKSRKASTKKPKLDSAAIDKLFD